MSKYPLMLGLAVIVSFIAGSTDYPLQSVQAQPDCVRTVRPGESIQQAVNQAPENTILCLSAGIFRENIQIGKSLKLQGIGREQTVIQSDSWKSAIHIDSSSAIHVQLDQLTIGDSGGAAGLLISGESDVEVQNSSLPHSLIGISVEDAAHLILRNSQVTNTISGIVVKNEANAEVIDSEVFNNSSGLRASGGANLTVQNSRIFQNRGGGIGLGDRALLELHESTSEQNGGCGIYVYSEDAVVRNFSSVVRENDIDLCGYAPADLRKPLVPETIRNLVIVPDDFKSLQEAVDAVAPGGTVKISTGLYETKLVIWKPVTLQGAGRDRTILNSGTVGISVLGSVTHTVIEGVKIAGAKHLALLVYGKLDLKDSQISGNEFGVQVYGSSQTLIQSSEISGNREDGLTAAGQLNLIVDNSAIRGNLRTGLGVYYLTHLKMRTTLISNNGIGMDLSGKTKSEIHDSIIEKNGGFGIWIWDAAAAVIQGSEINDNNEEGVFIGNDANVLLKESQVTRNGVSGILTYYDAKLEISDSVVERNGTKNICSSSSTDERGICNGLSAFDTTHVVVNNSIIRHNADWGVSISVRKCGYDMERFDGQVLLQGTNVIEKNNTAGNLDGKGNPGNHPYQQLPDGQICLP